jgi:hypothetical protein
VAGAIDVGKAGRIGVRLGGFWRAVHNSA